MAPYYEFSLRADNTSVQTVDIGGRPGTKLVRRPYGYTPDKATRICVYIVEGLSLRAIAKKPGMPTKATILHWLADNESFRIQYERATKMRTLARVEQVDQVVQDMFDGKIDWRVARVEIDAIKWQCGREKPKRYGDQVPRVAQTAVTFVKQLVGVAEDDL